ncbi:MAG: hypothetical protein C4520_06500 [Candidatus Abyssobacteria bacterium SURF_5]|uniref:UGSC-like domain-containing protein n=1 Tax=Abyssobacteria bacterium (strain SURF_5) TaxID=2093360 RepID=A0A3A4NRV8_ABYX5|nr:MAG: hypothetical protein C4520_06500 [Candidatus Abyssubacteria bacterium SURF_5]
MKVEVLNPVGEVTAEKQTLAGRQKNLAGKTVVFFGNAKPNVNLLFDNLVKMFAAKYPATKTVRKGKENAAFAAPEEYLQEAADAADLVICGVGD